MNNYFRMDVVDLIEIISHVFNNEYKIILLKSGEAN